MPALKTLPLADAFGNFWLGKKPRCAAIFKSVHRGKYFASLGMDRTGVLFEGRDIRYFDSPFDALAALEVESIS